MTASGNDTILESSPADDDRRLAGWVGACATAEAIGMTAAAAAARAGDTWFDDPGQRGLALVAVVLGGLVEGCALGVLQGRWLRARHSGFNLARWLFATVTIAGLGWAAASAPSALSTGQDTGGAPPLVPVLGGAAALGCAMGAVLGTAQSFSFARTSGFRLSWIRISAVAWTPTMVVIFGGAMMPAASWSTVVVVPFGTVTGVLAGGVLGVVSGTLMMRAGGPTGSSDRP